MKGNLVQVGGVKRRRGQGDRDHRRRPGGRHALDRRRLRPAAARHAADDPPGLAVRHRQPLRRPDAARPTAQRKRSDRDRRRRHDRRSTSTDDRRRARPALQHARPARPARPSRASSRASAPVTRQDARGATRGFQLPEPGAVHLAAACSTSSTSDTPTLERFIVDSSQLVTALAERRDDLVGADRQPEHDDRARSAARGWRSPTRSAAARLHAPGEHDVRGPARRARRRRPARRRLEAGRARSSPFLDELRRSPRDARPTVARPERRSCAARARTTT